MSHRIKKRPIINHNNYDNSKHNHHLLHSDKGTYFYKDSINSADDGNNENGYYHGVRSFFNLWRSLAHQHFSKARYCFTNEPLSRVPLMLSSFALLAVLGLMIFPLSYGNGPVYATDSEPGTATQTASANAKISFTIKRNGVVVADNDTVTTEVTAGVVTYINNTIEVTTTDINKFYVSVQAAEGATVNLVGDKHKQEIPPVANNTLASGFGDESAWGFALSDKASADPATLTYNPLPAYSEVPPIQYISGTNLANGTHTLALVFAAKINANKPADNYKTKAMVSIVADAKDI